MEFRVFIFILLFRTKGKKEHLDENDFRQGYGNYFESATLKATWYQLWSKFFLNNYEWHRQRYLKDTLQLKILQTCISIRPNSFLGKYHETNMGKGSWKIISCTKIWACFSKNISLITVFFFFPQGNLVLKFSLMLIK